MSAFKPKRLISYDNDSIINEIKRVISTCFGNKIPTIKNFHKHSMVHYNTIRGQFGSWKAAIEKAGFKPKSKTPSLKKQNRIIRIIKLKPKRFEEEDLLMEMKRVWENLGRRPSYAEFRKYSNIGMRVYEYRFGSWRNAVEKFCLKFNYDTKGLKGNEATPELLLHELKTIASKAGSKTLMFKKYKESGGSYSIGTFQSYFGSWKNAIGKIGLKDGHSNRYSKEELFDELQRVWELIGRQPEYRDMKKYGKIHGASFRHEFGRWMKAVHAFCSDSENLSKECDINKNVNDDSMKGQEENATSETILKSEETGGYIIMTTSRTPSKRLRFLVLKRDDFCCVKCGRNVNSYSGLELEVDHIKPYSKGGETVLENLQTLCKDCNRGKSDMAS